MRPSAAAPLPGRTAPCEAAQALPAALLLAPAAAAAVAFPALPAAPPLLLPPTVLPGGLPTAALSRFRLRALCWANATLHVRFSASNASTGWNLPHWRGGVGVGAWAGLCYSGRKAAADEVAAGCSGQSQQQGGRPRCPAGRNTQADGWGGGGGGFVCVGGWGGGRWSAGGRQWQRRAITFWQNLELTPSSATHGAAKCSRHTCRRFQAAFRAGQVCVARQ